MPWYNELNVVETGTFTLIFCDSIRKEDCGDCEGGCFIKIEKEITK